MADFKQVFLWKGGSLATIRTFGQARAKRNTARVLHVYFAWQENSGSRPLVGSQRRRHLFHSCLVFEIADAGFRFLL